MNTKGSQVNKGPSDGQTRSLQAMNIEKEVEMAVFATASNMARMEERRTDGKSSWMSLRHTGREWPSEEISQVTSEAE